MKTFSPPLRFLIIGLCAVAARADEAAQPGDAQVRAAVTRALLFLDKEADTWMDERDCNACHHMPGLIWSHREAQRRGIPIDEKKFAEFVDWSVSRAKKSKSSDEMVALMKLAMPDDSTPELALLIAKSQLPDGSWKAGGQFASMQRRDAAEATANSTRLALLALGPRAVTDETRAGAAAYLAKSGPPKSIETLVFRALYAASFGPPADAMDDRRQILQLQHPDGGWGWMIGEEQSDPLATGQALYLLQAIPGKGSGDAIARAQGWLVSHQREDGGWPIDITRLSRLDRSGPAKAKSFKDATGIYTFWGSAWATIGLEQEFPVVVPTKAP